MQWERRDHHKRMEKLRRGGANNGGGGRGGGARKWKTFEFGTSPKIDRRFDEAKASLSPSNATGIPNGVLNAIPHT